MIRGDVVRTVAELEALPIGTEVVDMDARLFKVNAGGVYPCDALGIASIEYPALVRVVGPVEPEWLEAAAVAALAADSPGGPTWQSVGDGSRTTYRDIAKAAVAAADKARGIVNSREEFDALPAGTQCKSAAESRGLALWTAGATVGIFGLPVESDFPLVVRRPAP